MWKWSSRELDTKAWGIERLVRMADVHLSILYQKVKVNKIPKWKDDNALHLVEGHDCREEDSMGLWNIQSHGKTCESYFLIRKEWTICYCIFGV